MARMKRQAGAQPGTARGAASMKSRGGRRRGRGECTVAVQPCVASHAQCTFDTE